MLHVSTAANAPGHSAGPWHLHPPLRQRRLRMRVPEVAARRSPLPSARRPHSCPNLSPRHPQAWDAPGTALLVNERMINVPPQVAPPLVQGVFDDLGAAAKDKQLPQVGSESLGVPRPPTASLAASAHPMAGDGGGPASAAQGSRLCRW